MTAHAELLPRNKVGRGRFGFAEESLIHEGMSSRVDHFVRSFKIRRSSFVLGIEIDRAGFGRRKSVRERVDWPQCIRRVL